MYVSSHFFYSYVAFRKIAQAGGGVQGQGELWCHGVVYLISFLRAVYYEITLCLLSHFSIALPALKPLYISHLISPLRCLI